MILGLHTSPTALGWAVLDESTSSFVDLGAVGGKLFARTSLTLEQARRSCVQARVLAEKAPECGTVIVERMTVAASRDAVPAALSWGLVVGIVAAARPRPKLLTIEPGRWRREVLPSMRDAAIDDELARAAATNILRRHPRAVAALGRLSKSLRVHALDAAMIALTAALRPHRCEVIVGQTKESA